MRKSFVFSRVSAKIPHHRNAATGKVKIIRFDNNLRTWILLQLVLNIRDESIICFSMHKVGLIPKFFEQPHGIVDNTVY